MDYLRTVKRLVPDVEWQDGISGSSLQSVKDHFYSPSGQPFPSNAEGLAMWATIQAEDVAEAEEADALADLAKANTWLTNQITPMTSLTGADRIKLRDILLRMHKNHKYGG